jgi:hypothetical protein
LNSMTIIVLSVMTLGQKWSIFKFLNKVKHLLLKSGVAYVSQYGLSELFTLLSVIVRQPCATLLVQAWGQSFSYLLLDSQRLVLLNEVFQLLYGVQSLVILVADFVDDFVEIAYLLLVQHQIDLLLFYLKYLV